MLGIVILNYETWNVSLTCMKSIVSSGVEEAYRIYLVDNASKNEMPGEVAEYIEKYRICVLRAEKNSGYAAGNNIGIKKALEDGCQYILITNNDIIFQNDSIDKMCVFLKNNPRAGIAGPKVVGIDGKWQASAVSVKTDLKHVFMLYTVAKIFFKKTGAGYFRKQENPDETAEVYHVSGCCFLMNRQTAEYLYPLDENTFLYNEELIIGVRLEQAGISTYYVPEAVVQHHHGFTTDRVKPFMYQCISTSEIYYCKRYLRASDRQVWLLMEYRKILYRIRMRKDSEMKRYWNHYKTAVQDAWKKWKGLSID